MLTEFHCLFTAPLLYAKTQLKCDKMPSLSFIKDLSIESYVKAK